MRQDWNLFFEIEKKKVTNFIEFYFKNDYFCVIILIGIGVHRYLLFYYTSVKEAKYANTGIKITKFSQL